MKIKFINEQGEVVFVENNEGIEIVKDKKEKEKDEEREDNSRN